MPESTIRVLRGDCPYAENLVGVFRWRICVEREASFFESGSFRGEKNNPCRSSLNQKFSVHPNHQAKNLFFALLSSSGGKIFYSTTCIIWRQWWEQSRPEPYLFLPFLGPAILQGRMTSWDWSLRRLHWKLFKWSFHSRRWSGRRCRISNLDSYVDQKNHLDKDA